jgi:hypothetical protein
MLAEEQRRGVGTLTFYKDFSHRVARTTARLSQLLTGLKADGKRIACYGAAAKGATLVNYLGLGEGFFDYVVDRNPHKQAKLMPGQRIPIGHPDRLLEDQPDYVLLLVWNFANEVLRDQAAYQEAGGRFIIPVPDPHIIDPGSLPLSSVA